MVVRSFSVGGPIDSFQAPVSLLLRYSVVYNVVQHHNAWPSRPPFLIHLVKQQGRLHLSVSSHLQANPNILFIYDDHHSEWFLRHQNISVRKHPPIISEMYLIVLGASKKGSPLCRREDGSISNACQRIHPCCPTLGIRRQSSSLSIQAFSVCRVKLLQLYTIGERGDWLAAPPGYASPVVPSKRYTAQIIVLILSTYRFWRPHVCGGADYRIWR